MNFAQFDPNIEQYIYDTNIDLDKVRYILLKYMHLILFLIINQILLV